ncbi:hypothetical protein TWF970_011168 [Orbilia oligospora]|uniref:Uncharacterized protein n=1 Tax=Orbilia oligospora TaxID=2813651 RepID=A0A7C8RFM5_ORBOL|nr:hypothetical protein TWF970_011168 [Orbilia oligospora]
MFLPPNNQIKSNQLTSTGPVFNQNEAQVPNGDELILLLLLFFSVTRTCMEVDDVSGEPVYVSMMWWVWWLVRREEQKKRNVRSNGKSNLARAFASTFLLTINAKPPAGRSLA